VKPHRSQLLTQSEIECLLSQRCISQVQPWVTNDARLIEKHLADACAATARETTTQSRIEWNHYGSGYASFVDAWFYRNTSEFNVQQPGEQGEAHTGLVVLFSRLSPYFVFLEGEKRWHGAGGSSYLPAFGMLDQLKTQGVSLLAKSVQPILERCGLIRAYYRQLSEPLPADIPVPTILTDDGFTQFDALFYWED
jgi:hypothetical protein